METPGTPGEYTLRGTVRSASAGANDVTLRSRRKGSWRSVYSPDASPLQRENARIAVRQAREVPQIRIKITLCLKLASDHSLR